MNKKIAITGATGLIGIQLCNALKTQGNEITILSRNVESAKKIFGDKFSYIKWDYKNPIEWQESLCNKDAVIHLAGANLFAKRWTKNYKKEILESRHISTKNLVTALINSKCKNKILLSSSAVGYYGSRSDDVLYENSGRGADFLANVCEVWEKEAENANKFGIRTVTLRQGIVLSSKGGALTKFLPAFNFFVGGPLGNGKQWFPWIHIEDLTRIYLFILNNLSISGPVNAVSPKSIRMNEFAKTLGKILKRPSVLKVPEFALKMLVGEAATSILSSQRVVPQKLLDHNFKFKFDNLEEALKDLLK
ncbi:MAG: TIGR01777 family protein [Ignavibacteriaceae bacterium]|nr:TIGR01777 family protein [Ignavibacteriaceae bacterium]